MVVVYRYGHSVLFHQPSICLQHRGQSCHPNFVCFIASHSWSSDMYFFPLVSKSSSVLGSAWVWEPEENKRTRVQVPTNMFSYKSGIILPVNYPCSLRKHIPWYLYKGKLGAVSQRILVYCLFLGVARLFPPIQKKKPQNGFVWAKTLITVWMSPDLWMIPNFP